MSSMYYRVEPRKVPSPRFGYGKVDRKELQTILSRVTQPRPNSRGRPGTSASARPKSSKSISGRRHPTEEDWERIIRRLQRPTLSQRLARQQESAVEETQPDKGKRSRPKSSRGTSWSMKLQKLSRPTTASTAKSIVTCHLCGQDIAKDVFPESEYTFVDNRYVPQEEVDTITARLRTHTCSSHPQSRPCTRSRLNMSPDPMIQDGRLPLISGLNRSKTVSEITERLQPSKRCGTTPKATPISSA